MVNFDLWAVAHNSVSGLSSEMLFTFFDVLGLVSFRVPRLAARCRGGSRRRGRSRKVWDLACKAVPATKNRITPPLAVASSEVLLPPAPSLSVSNETCKLGASVFFAVASLFEPCSRLESLTRLSPDASTTCGEKGRGTGVHPREDKIMES